VNIIHAFGKDLSGEIIQSDFDCSENNLASLEGTPKSP